MCLVGRECKEHRVNFKVSVYCSYNKNMDQYFIVIYINDLLDFSNVDSNIYL